MGFGVDFYFIFIFLAFFWCVSDLRYLGFLEFGVNADQINGEKQFYERKEESRRG